MVIRIRCCSIPTMRSSSRSRSRDRDRDETSWRVLLGVVAGVVVDVVVDFVFVAGVLVAVAVLRVASRFRSGEDWVKN